MAYTKNTWVDQDVTRPKTYAVTTNADSTITLTDSFGVVTEIGTPVNATNMNHIENGIEDCDTAITSLQAEVTAMYPKIDGQWVSVNATPVSNLNIHNNSDTPYTVNIAQYLPNDNETYEVLLDGLLESSSTSGQYAALFVFGTAQAFHLCAIRPRTNASVTVAGNGVVTVGSARTFQIARRSNYYGSATVTIDAYRRVGTNS